jgi:hypothetical protein
LIAIKQCSSLSDMECIASKLTALKMSESLMAAAPVFVTSVEVCLSFRDFGAVHAETQIRKLRLRDVADAGLRRRLPAGLHDRSEHDG